jgi:hypothetical protein
MHSLKRALGIILACLAAAALFGALRMSFWWPRTFLIQLPPRFWACPPTTLGHRGCCGVLVGVLIGGLALVRPATRSGTTSRRLEAGRSEQKRHQRMGFGNSRTQGPRNVTFLYILNRTGIGGRFRTIGSPAAIHPICWSTSGALDER